MHCIGPSRGSPRHVTCIGDKHDCMYLRSMIGAERRESGKERKTNEEKTSTENVRLPASIVYLCMNIAVSMFNDGEHVRT